MPIAFPPLNMDTMLTDVRRLSKKPFFVVPAPNMDAPNLLFKPFITDLGKAMKRINVRELGQQFRDVRTTSEVNRAGDIITANFTFNSVLGILRVQLSGVTKDSGGVALGFCSVDLFITATDGRISTTTSDAAGNFSFDLLVSGPFYMVAYLAGIPDVAGTTVNTLTFTVQ